MNHLDPMTYARGSEHLPPPPSAYEDNDTALEAELDYLMETGEVSTEYDTWHKEHSEMRKIFDEAEEEARLDQILDDYTNDYNDRYYCPDEEDPF